MGVRFSFVMISDLTQGYGDVLEYRNLTIPKAQKRFCHKYSLRKYKMYINREGKHLFVPIGDRGHNDLTGMAQ